MTHESTAAGNTTQAVPATAGEAAGSSAVFRYLVPAWPVCGCAAGADICFHTNGCTLGYPAPATRRLSWPGGVCDMTAHQACIRMSPMAAGQSAAALKWPRIRRA